MANPPGGFPRVVSRRPTGSFRNTPVWLIEWTPGNFSDSSYRTQQQAQSVLNSRSGGSSRSFSGPSGPRRTALSREEQIMRNQENRSQMTARARGTTTGHVPGSATTGPLGECQPPNAADFVITDPFTGKTQKDTAAYNQAVMDYQDCLQGSGGAGRGGGGASGPTVVDYMSSVIDSINTEIDARRLRSDQAVQEFQRRMDAFKTSGDQFQGLQPYTIPGDAKYIPGLEPGGFGQSIGLAPVGASPISYNPFETAFKIVQQTPDITSIGAPDVSQIVNLAKSFVGQ